MSVHVIDGVIFHGGHGTTRSHSVTDFVRIADVRTLGEDAEVARHLGEAHGKPLGIDVEKLTEDDLHALRAFAERHEIMVVAREAPR